MSTPLIEYARAGRPLDDVPVFDAHAHVGGMTGLDAPPLEQQVAEMDRLGIDLAAVSATTALAGDMVRGNDEVADAIRRFPDRLVGYCHVSGNYPELMESELARCFAIEGFRGLKFYQVGCPYDSDRFAPAWEFARQRGLPILAHTWGGEMTGLPEAAGKNPDVTFLAAHTGSAFAYRPYVEAAGQHPNLWLDLTYSREHTNMIEHIVESVGADRIIWGTDAPCFSMSHQLSKILFARIPDADKRKIIHDNAARLFDLP